MGAGADLELFESKKYRKVIIDSGDMIAIVDERYNYLFASKMFMRYIGMKKADITGHTVPEVMGEDLFRNEIKPNIDKSLQGKRTAFEISLPVSKLGDRFFHLKCYPVMEKGVRTVIVLAMDITKLKQRERSLLRDHQIYRTVLEKATDILLLMDPDGIIISCNRYIDRQTGLSSKNVVGRSVKCILTPRSYSVVVKHLDDWKNRRARSQTWEVEVVGQGGKPVPFEVHSTPVYERGKLKWVVVIARNISERKYVEEKLKRSYRDLEERLDTLTRDSQGMLQRAKEEFNRLSSRILEDQERERHAIGRELHDEMGGYLTILGIYLGKMAKDPENTAWREQFTQAFDEMVQYVRSLSHSLYPVMLEKGDLLSALKSYFENYKKRTGIDVVFRYKELPRRLPLYIETVIYRIIQEALTNVAKHAAAERVNIIIMQFRNTMKIIIEDNGRGFDVSKAGTTDAYGISGMKNRALFAGGNLVVNSSPGQGTSIICTLQISGVNESWPPSLPLRE